MSSVLIFVYFFLLGIILGILYDLFKILRILITKNTFIFFIDILYFVIGSLLTFVLSIYVNLGIIRGFIFQGELFGFIVYKCILGRVFFGFMRKILFGIKVVRFIKKPKLFIFNNNSCKK